MKKKRLFRSDLDNAFSFKWVAGLLTFNNSQSLSQKNSNDKAMEHNRIFINSLTL